MEKEQLKELILNEESTREQILEAVEAVVGGLEASLEQASKNIESLEKQVKELQAPASKVVQKKVNKQGQVKIKILHPVTGKFLLPYNVGQVVSLDEKQADELVEARYAEYV